GGIGPDRDRRDDRVVPVGDDGDRVVTGVRDGDLVLQAVIGQAPGKEADGDLRHDQIRAGRDHRELVVVQLRNEQLSPATVVDGEARGIPHGDGAGGVVRVRYHSDVVSARV